MRDDPLLTARPPGPRTAVRVVLDTQASLASESQLGPHAQSPVLVAVGEDRPPADRERLGDAGCEVFVCDGETPAARLDALLVELGRRRLTNVLVEGGSRLLGSLLDVRQIDEVHVFLAPKLFGGAAAPRPLPARVSPKSPQRWELESPCSGTSRTATRTSAPECGDEPPPPYCTGMARRGPCHAGSLPLGPADRTGRSGTDAGRILSEGIAQGREWYNTDKSTAPAARAVATSGCPGPRLGDIWAPPPMMPNRRQRRTAGTIAVFGQGSAPLGYP